MKSILLAILASLTMATHSVAGSYPFPEPQIAFLPAPAQDWSGFYLGGTAGYDFGFGRVRLLSTGEYLPDRGPIAGAAYGVFAGYNFQFNDFVVGGEVYYHPNRIIAEQVPSRAIENLADIKLKFGLSKGKYLFFGFGGSSQGQFTTLSPIIDRSVAGPVFGVGVQSMISENMFVGVEFSRSQLANVEPYFLYRYIFDINSLNLRVGYQF